MAEIQHFDNHPHAIVGSDNRVITVGAFDGHDTDLHAVIVEALNAQTIVCCCDHGSVPGTGDVWDGTTFTRPEVEVTA